MKNSCIIIILVLFQLLSISAHSQSNTDSDTLGLPGDNLNLFAVLDLFQKSKTIEEFEKTLNDEKTAINNLDLNLDKKVDFIKVVTKQNGEDFSFILQIDVSEKETQDVAVILVSKDKDKKVSIQIVGDKELYGKDYIVEPQPKTTPAVTANPGYTGPDTVIVSAPAKTTVVVVEQTPIVQYVYSPVYVPYYPPYHYAYYPPYYTAFAVVAVSAYHHNKATTNNTNKPTNNSNKATNNNTNKSSNTYNKATSNTYNKPSNSNTKTSTSTRPTTSNRSYGGGGRSGGGGVRSGGGGRR